MAGDLTVTWRGWRGPGGQFARQAEASLYGTLDTLAARLLALAREEAPQAAAGNQDPSGTPPGELRRLLRVDRADSGAAGSLTLTSPAPYTPYVIRGRGEITARGKALRFWIGGRVVFAKHVKGVAPNDFLQRANERFQPEVQSELGRLVGTLRTQLLSNEE